VGNFAGAPISGALLDASTHHGERRREDYLPVILFAGSVALTSAVLLAALRYRADHTLWKKL
jgi:hypothetical protein